MYILYYLMDHYQSQFIISALAVLWLQLHGLLAEEIDTEAKSNWRIEKANTESNLAEI